MSDDLAVRLRKISKMYKVFADRRARLLDAVGLGRFAREPAREFWSLRDIDLSVPRGARIGIIGRNGAGKSSLLKLISGSIAPTEGEISVRGQVQALFDAGTGFHPEFTGYENIRASLTYQGLDSPRIEAAVEDIAEFTELGKFLNQAIKTYSSGMMARLAFATATSVSPDILIVDEILGAGDAYFASKSTERMRRLVEDSGATVLLVSHSVEQILLYCDDCIWLERGRVVRQGRALEVVNAYQSFIQDLEERRLRAKNRRRLSTRTEVADFETNDCFEIQLQWRGEPGSSCAISELRLVKDGVTVEELKVGDVQDSSIEHSAAIVLAGSNWSEPRKSGGVFFRTLDADAQAAALGRVTFRMTGTAEEGDYALAIKYRAQRRGTLVLKAALNAASLVSQAEAPEWGDEWAEWSQPLGHLGDATGQFAPRSSPEPKETFRWASEGSLTIAQIKLMGRDETSRALFHPGDSLRLSFDVRANRDGDFQLVSGASLYRMDGIFLCNLISEPMPMTLKVGESRRLTVEIPSLPMGDGSYVFSLSIFEKAVTGESRYDLVSRCIEFKVTGNDQLHAGVVFHQPANWSVA